MPADSLSEERLVRDCLKGSDEAWSALVDRYQNLVYSIPLKWGITGDDASDIFQSVFFELLSHLPTIRNPKALPMWLIQTASHKCQEFRKRQQRFTSLDDNEEAEPAEPGPNGEKILAEFQRDRTLNQALEGLSPRCRRLVDMLFFESPARPYDQIARDLGTATGSIGFIRGRCLEKLRQLLGKAGFP
jgi:RNA polymerase sigma factor (sigma-70 family)